MKKERSDNKIQNLFTHVKTVIRTKDFDASKNFYSQILGLDIIEEYDEEMGVRGCILRIGKTGSNAFIEISAIDTNHPYFDSSFARVFDNDKMDLQIKTNSINYWANHIETKWIHKGPIKRPWGAIYLYLRDPDGLQIIIYQEKD